jgi:hypothetical protein
MATVGLEPMLHQKDNIVAIAVGVMPDRTGSSRAEQGRTNRRGPERTEQVKT